MLSLWINRDPTLSPSLSCCQYPCDHERQAIAAGPAREKEGSLVGKSETLRGIQISCHPPRASVLDFSARHRVSQASSPLSQGNCCRDGPSVFASLKARAFAL